MVNHLALFFQLHVVDMPNERGLLRTGSYDGIDVTISENQPEGASGSPRLTRSHTCTFIRVRPTYAKDRETSRH